MAGYLVGLAGLETGSGGFEEGARRFGRGEEKELLRIEKVGGRRTDCSTHQHRPSRSLVDCGAVFHSSAGDLLWSIARLVRINVEKLEVEGPYASVPAFKSSTLGISLYFIFSVVLVYFIFLAYKGRRKSRVAQDLSIVFE